MQMGVWISLSAYFLLMIAIGVYAWRKSTSNSEEYILGGRDLGPSVTALSAGASDMSGWLLLGLPGALFVAGLSQAWIGVGLVLGAWANWLIVAPRLREQTEFYDSLTIPGFLGKRFPSTERLLRMVSAIIIVVFFAVYTASGLVGGGKLFASAFGGDYMVGISLTLGIVLVYTVIGGFLAVSLTDFVQGCIMMLALVIMPIVILTSDGSSASEAAARVTAIDPEFFSLSKGVTAIGWISAMAWGLGYFGQPHIIVRFMAIRSVKDVPAARRIGMSWMIVSLAGALAVGVFGRAYALRTGLEVADPETIFILLSDLLFHPLVTGFLYAALLAAIMSTVSSQLLVASSSLTEDIYHALMKRDASERELVNIGRLAVLAVGVVALIIAADPESEVLGLVANAWAGFGAAFGPLIVLSLTWKRMTGAGAVAGLIVGAVTVIAWIAMGLSSTIYEIVPGFIASFLAIVAVSMATADQGEYRHQKLA
ncbi:MULTISPECIES: sodium/proline symporter PutP [Paracoccus]|jgi:SSS family solute:Na+ symporter|uniref:Sodium/proline symporter n=1 Tax=Paracoccus litorisediminis TaxID=2006130 RepID=A0A844HNC6_9RHOB|nr:MULTISPECIES: sodium/proline symporter PutP [Paracoccus]MBD9528134.1 sodium/proline symporter PutP [Paracoccus sp. PAR01]MTH59162.1 sodium/proline symporter PutP [Paracoccus litorisediminis]